jgi:Golgi SNAP receptor complex protein 1
VPAATQTQTHTGSPTSINNNNSNSNSSDDDAAISNNSSNEHVTMSQSFDQLKREAVRLERSLEDKVSKYQQVRTAMYCIVL